MAKFSRGDLHLVVAIFLGALIAVQAWDASDTGSLTGTWDQPPSGSEDTGALARAIFVDWALPFEVLSVLLLVALVAGLAMASRARGGGGER